MSAAAPRFLRLYLCLQWGIGALADMASTGFGLDPAHGLRVAFAAVLVAETLAYLWFALGWRRHARAGALASARAHL
jgi:hypothetical protein